MGKNFWILIVLASLFYVPSWGKIKCTVMLKPMRDASTVSAHPRVPRTFRFMTYNVHNLMTHTGRYIWGDEGQYRAEEDSYSGKKTEAHTQEIAKIIHETAPDILLLQEVEGMDSMKRFIENYLGDEYVAFMPPTNDEREIGLALLIKDDLKFHVRVETFERLSWTNPAGHIEPIFARNVGLFEVFDPETDEVAMAVFGLHYKSKRDRRDDPESFIKRSKEVEETVRAIEKFQAVYPDVPFLVAGDLNSDSEDPEFDPFYTQLGVIDPLRQETFNDKYELGRATHSYHPKNKKPTYGQLDTIFIDPSLENKLISSDIYRYKDEEGRVKRLPRTMDERKQNPSDHYPVYVDIDPKAFYPAEKK